MAKAYRNENDCICRRGISANASPGRVYLYTA